MQHPNRMRFIGFYCSSQHVGSQRYLQWNLALRQFGDKLRVINGSDPVADPIRPKPQYFQYIL